MRKLALTLVGVCTLAVLLAPAASAATAKGAERMKAGEGSVGTCALDGNASFSAGLYNNGRNDGKPSRTTMNLPGKGCRAGDGDWSTVKRVKLWARFTPNGNRNCSALSTYLEPKTFDLVWLGSVLTKTVVKVTAFTLTDISNFQITMTGKAEDGGSFAGQYFTVTLTSVETVQTLNSQCYASEEQSPTAQYALREIAFRGTVGASSLVAGS